MNALEPPAAPRRPTTRSLHGESVVDAFAWMRDDDDPALHDYLTILAESLIELVAPASLPEALGEDAWDALDSDVADLKNIGDKNGGMLVAGIFLREFVGGGDGARVPWAHVDIAGTAQQPAVRTWRNKGASGFGALLLVELATRFESPRSEP